MKFASVDEYIRTGAVSAPAIALMFCEDEFLAVETARHLRGLGFDEIVACGPGAAALEAEGAAVIAAKAHQTTGIVNALAEKTAGWLLTCWNGEFPFFPNCETRSIRDFIDFLGSERRRACMAYSVDLYSDALAEGGAIDLDDVHFDAEGWYGFDRDDGRVDVYGGLGWRFEEYAPVSMSRINRPALFQGGPGARLLPDMMFEDNALNTVACPWHNNPTLALMSFRRSRVLLSHPNFKNAVETLKWPNSHRFEWSSEQLLRLGLIEAGQWI